jgi:PAS domain S-box-containing protein
VETAFVLPSLSAALWFVLEYGDLRRWLVPRIRHLLLISAVLFFLSMLGDGSRHWVWTGFTVEALVYPQRSALGQFWFVCGLAISCLSLLAFVWLFFRSPLQRSAVGLCILGQVTVRLAYFIQHSHRSPSPFLDLTVIGLAFTHLTYFLALFPLRLFDLIPIARDTLVEQMREGMLVLGPERQVVDLNPAARRMLGVEALRVRGREAFAALPALQVLQETINSGHPGEVELALFEGDLARSHASSVSVLEDRRGRQIGHLILLYDITEQKRAQREMVEQQRALATLRERDLLARELHDGLGQLLGYVKLQAEALRGMLQRGQQAKADACLAQLAAVAQDAHADVREYIMSARTGLPPEAGLLSMLETYVERFSEASGIRTGLDVAPGLSDEAFEPMIAAQLLRIVQEALTNIRKHAGAVQAQVRLSLQGDWAEVSVEDKGAGFDSASLDVSGARRFGLRFMKERAEEVGGELRISSSPGRGTCITIRVPLLRRACESTAGR